MLDYFKAWRDLFKRYHTIWQAAWQQRHSLDTPVRNTNENQFLPAALALQDTPVHPAPRITQWIIVAFALIALLWACVGKMDVVATATGKIVANGKSKLVQSSRVAVIKSIYVRDGQQVQAGELLVELDSEFTQADIERLQSELDTAFIDQARSQLFLEAIEQKTQPGLLTNQLPQLDNTLLYSAQHGLHSQWLEYTNSLAQADALIQQRQAEYTAAQASVTTLEQSLPITRQQAADYQRLLAGQHVARHAYLEKEQTRLQHEGELITWQQRSTELKAALTAAEEQRQGIIVQQRRQLIDLHNEAQQRIDRLSPQLAQAQYQHRLMFITAPVNGSVQQLAIHTAGGVVTEAQPLMVIVPDNEPVEVEALLENKDSGFVQVGQEVQVKIETFNFTKYGLINGTVHSISKDAIEDPQRGLVYSTRIQLEKDTIQVNNHAVALSPGMAVRAEIKTDRRRIIDYFLSPLKQYASESFRER